MEVRILTTHRQTKAGPRAWGSKICLHDADGCAQRGVFPGSIPGVHKGRVLLCT